MNSVVIFTVGCVLSIGIATSGRGDGPRSDEGNKWKGRPAEVDAQFLKNWIERGDGIQDLKATEKSELTPREILDRLYAQQIDVDPQVKLASGLEEISPEKASDLVELFNKRLESREKDDSLWAELVEKKWKSKAIKQISERERERTVALCDSLTLLFSIDERSVLVKGLIRKIGYRALTFPIAEAEFKISNEQRIHLTNTYSEFRDEYEKLRSEKRRERVSSLGIEKYMKALRCLSREQLVKYFRIEGSLAEDETLEDLPGKFEGELSTGVKRLLAFVED